MHFKCHVPLPLKPEELLARVDVLRCCSLELTQSQGSSLGRWERTPPRSHRQWRRFTPRCRLSNSNLALLHPKEKHVCLISLPFYTHKGKSEDTWFTFTTSQDLPAWASLRPKDRLHSKSLNSTWAGGRAREGMLDWLSWEDQKKLGRIWIKADHQGHLVTDCQKIHPMFYLNRLCLPFGWTLSWSL